MRGSKTKIFNTAYAITKNPIDFRNHDEEINQLQSTLIQWPNENLQEQTIPNDAYATTKNPIDFRGHECQIN